MKKLRLRLYVRDFFHRMKFKRTAPLRGRYEISDWRETIDCIIALPHCMFEKEISHMKIESRYFWEKFTNKWFKRMAETVLKPGVPYGDATITRAYNCLKDKTQSHERFSALKALWNNRNLLIIEGSQTRMGVGNDLYSNAASIRRILVPATNAFSRYDEILQATLSAFTPPRSDYHRRGNDGYRAGLRPGTPRMSGLGPGASGYRVRMVAERCHVESQGPWQVYERIF